MVLGASLTSLAASVGAIVFFGHVAPAQVLDFLALTGVISAFTAICSTEALLAS